MTVRAFPDLVEVKVDAAPESKPEPGFIAE
jgi:hypothetical protein